jgi:hypothetical protein
MRRRRSRFDPKLIPFAGIAFVLVAAWSFPRIAYLEGFVFAAAAIAIWYTSARKRLIEVHRWSSVSNMYALSPEDFERHVASTYASLGYRVSTTRRIGDQGIDVLAERGAERLGIQCKRTTETVSNGAVQEAYAGQAHYGCTSAAVVSLGGFTSPARALASSTGVLLIDGRNYADIFHRATMNTPPRPLWSALPDSRRAATAIACAAVAAIALYLGVTHVTDVPGQQFSTVIARSPAARAPADAVTDFYTAINGKHFDEAYALLSPSFVKSMSYNSFRAGYKTTQSVKATIIGSDGTTVRVHLIATDQNSDGSSRTTNYDGHWTAVSDGSGGWLLDEGAFRRS